MADGSDTNGAPTETFALETRAETLSLLSRTKAARNGESDRLEVGHGGGSDTVLGTEELRVGGNLSEHANGKVTQAERLETSIDGKMSLRAFSDTTLMAGAMTDVQTGAMLTLAGMSDDLCIGGGMRLTMMDLWVCGLMGMEENPMSALADAVFLEGYRVHFEREYGAGIHLVGAATFTGSLHCTMATGFRALAKVAFGVRNMSPGGGSADSGDNTAAAPVAPVAPVDPGGAPNNNSNLLTVADDAAQVDEVTQLDEAVTAAQQVEPQSLDNVQDSASALDEVKNTNVDPNPPPDYPAPRPPPDDVDDAARRADEATELYATFKFPGFEDGTFNFEKTDIELGIINPNGSLDGFEDGIIPGWMTDGEYDDLIPLTPLSADPYQTPNVVTLPDDFDFQQAISDFNKTVNDDYRLQTMPGLSIMQTANNEIGQLPYDELRMMDTRWLAEAGIGADDLEQMRRNPSRAYQAIVDMEAAARAAGDLEKADELRRTLEYIDTRAFIIMDQATKAAEEVRATAFLPISSNFKVDSALEDLEVGVTQLQAQSLDAADADDMDQVQEIAQKISFYNTAIDALKNGYDPTPYLAELYKTSSMFADGDPKILSAINTAYDEVLNILGDVNHLFDPDLPTGFMFDVDDVATGPKGIGDWRDMRGIPADFDYNSYRNYLLGIVDNAGDADVAEIQDALENIDDVTLAQLNAVPSDYIEQADMWQEFANAKASQDPAEAYRVLEQMEAFYRQFDDTASASKADTIRGMLDTIDAVTVDEYTKVYSLVEEIASGTSVVGPAPFIPAPSPVATGADEASELDNARQSDSRNVYDHLTRADLGPDEAATFDDVQAGLDINPNQLDIEASAGEDPVYATVNRAAYDDIVIQPRTSDGQYANISDYQNVGAIEDAEANYALLGHRGDQAIYGDFMGPLTIQEKINLSDVKVQFNNTDGYVTPAMAQNKWKQAGDWTTEATNHKRFFDFDADPLLTWDPVRQEHVVEGTDGIVYKFDMDTGKLVPADPVNAPPPPPPPPLDDPEAMWVWDEAAQQHVKVDPVDLPPPPPPGDEDAIFKFDPETGTFTRVDDVDVPPAAPPVDNPLPTSVETETNAFSGYGAENLNYEDTTIPADDEIYAITRQRIEFAEEGAYNSLVFSFQQQAPDSIYSTLDEMKMSTEFVDAPTNTYVNVNYDNGRAVLVQSLDSADDVVTPPPVQPTGLNQNGTFVMRIDDDGQHIAGVYFAGGAADLYPSMMSADATEALYESLSPVLVSPFEEATSPTVTRADGTVGVIEASWQNTDPVTTVLNREGHMLDPEGFYASIDTNTQLSKVNQAVNSFTDVQQSGGAAFNLAELENIQEIDLVDETMWQLAADPVLNSKLHEMSAQGDDVVSLVLGRGGLGGSGARPRW